MTNILAKLKGKMSFLKPLVALLFPVEKFARHEKDMVKFYSQFIRKGDLCFDVGANVGNRVKIFLEIGARVVAIEPQSECSSILMQMYGSRKNFSLVQKALGAAEGEIEMLSGRENVLASVSPEWIESVTKSGRFPGHTWNQTQTVSVTTLDSLIAKHGNPTFIKIDVEGFEFQVLSGLSKPIKALSFEFTPEFFGAVQNTIFHLQNLGNPSFNYSLGESMHLELEEWVNAAAIEKILYSIDSHTLFGDVYVRFQL